MSITARFTTEALISTPTGSTTDAEGNAKATRTTDTVLGHLQPFDTSRSVTAEIEGDLDVATQLSTFWCPLDTDVDHTSKVLIGADTYEVIGTPQRWEVDSADDHVEVLLRKVTL